LIALPKTPRARREALEGYIFLLPWLLGFILFTAGPLLASFYLGFTSYRGDRSWPDWIGFANFTKLFQDELFWQSLKVTVVYAVGFLPPGMALGFGIALLMNQRVKGVSLFRTIYYLPSVITGVAVAVLWGFVFHKEFGILNSVLGWVGITPISWLFDSRWVMVAFIIMGLWGVGDGMIIYLAGLQDIPDTLYEAASIDGASWLRQLVHVTIPLMTPTIFFTLVMGIIGTFQVFSVVFVLTDGMGGPLNSTLVYLIYVYRNAFVFFRMGYASALSLILFLIILVLTLANVRLAGRWVYSEVEME
jgi:multiple sugar transport system permease protein